VEDHFNTTTDAFLIEQIRSGNKDAFNQLVNRWQKPIYRFAYGYFADPAEADEITQKTFIKVYHKLESLKKTEKFSSWIFRIATHLCIDVSRKNGKVKTKPLDAWVGSSQVTTTVTPESRLEKSELDKLLQKALLAIPNEQRTVIILKEYEELTFREIAEILEESENTVKSRMYYGLKALRKIFRKWNIEKEALYHE
jgi:RNA polymerase sigma-70 factor, ECF subfamily